MAGIDRGGQKDRDHENGTNDETRDGKGIPIHVCTPVCLGGSNVSVFYELLMHNRCQAHHTLCKFPEGFRRGGSARRHRCGGVKANTLLVDNFYATPEGSAGGRFDLAQRAQPPGACWQVSTTRRQLPHPKRGVVSWSSDSLRCTGLCPGRRPAAPGIRQNWCALRRGRRQLDVQKKRRVSRNPDHRHRITVPAHHRQSTIAEVDRSISHHAPQCRAGRTVLSCLWINWPISCSVSCRKVHDDDLLALCSHATYTAGMVPEQGI